MGFITGTTPPLTYNQDNSGTDTDITTVINYTPQEFGAPPGAQISVGLFSPPQPSVHRGSAAVRDVTVTPTAISFEVWTQAASGGLFGHHSGSITVVTSFSWWAFTPSSPGDEELVPSEEGAVGAMARIVRNNWL